VLPTPDWTTQAACHGLATRESDPWHPDGDGTTLAFAIARRFCQGCPVRLDCLHEGLALLPVAAVYGMYGGLAPDELRALARSKGLPARKIAKHGTRARYVAPYRCRCDLCVRENARREHERRLARSSSPLPPRCAAVTAVSRKPCSYPARDGSAFCGYHRPADVAA
jgi:hypothetical protein